MKLDLSNNLKFKIETPEDDRKDAKSCRTWAIVITLALSIAVCISVVVSIAVRVKLNFNWTNQPPMGQNENPRKQTEK